MQVFPEARKNAGAYRGDTMGKGPGSGDAPSSALSRRKLLAGAGIAGAAATGVALTQKPHGLHHHVTVTPAAAQTSAAPRRVEAFENLTSAEAETLEALVARIIPSDESGPGAKEARAAHYIDRALGGYLSGSKAAYIIGLAAVEAYAGDKHKSSYLQLSPALQDAVLTDIEKNVATGFQPSAAAFFNLLRAHTIEGTFCDPYHGGNANFVGWEMIRYPGIRTTVLVEDQRMNPKPKRELHSAYDEDMFTKGVSNGHHP